MSENDVLTDEELAVEWKTTPRAIQNLCRSGKLRAFKVHAQAWRITRGAVDEYEASRRAS